ncbi:sensor histidine kinase [Runella slithyformis]|uniref:histidine kinase n=1 Tax=Runella slithyformis (strain ATCC 29530 / DSM 19594 / LMG 11500 / NCIMB 11436 / LSU 4) TaxID=761193 RepID=A0A7U3ZJK9_RUNSL|nr:ATP-binding protein [Runella slithyformis]AEI48395.1 integral membrane sensor signal transduction histidine kinase [Runella slithyformis DSM 19594]
MKHFSIGILWRVFWLVLSLCALLYFVPDEQWVLSALMAFMSALAIFQLYYYTTGTNRKLARFFESVRYSDFAVKFRSDDKMGESFREINQQFNEVLEAFRIARAEKEANLQYLNTIVQHISTGLISFGSDGRVELVNSAALKMLGIYRLRQLDDLREPHPQLFTLIATLRTGVRQLYQTSDDESLSVQATQIQLRGKVLRILVLQNIQTELQQKEIEAWQNLTRVLRHEIMNSLTPILSLVGTMKEIVQLDIAPVVPDNEGVQDLTEALQTLQKRSAGIIQFVNAYRDFTTLPKPMFVEMPARELLGGVLQLFQKSLQEASVKSTLSIVPESLVITADADQIEQVLINLVKNACEALQGQPNGLLTIRAYSDMNQRVYIEVTDNGQGIEPEALERIFIPFYTTKKTGSGIGLSLSRQILQQHGGQLSVTSEVGKGTTFVIVL